MKRKIYNQEAKEKMNDNSYSIPKNVVSVNYM